MDPISTVDLLKVMPEIPLEPGKKCVVNIGIVATEGLSELGRSACSIVRHALISAVPNVSPLRKLSHKHDNLCCR